MTRTTAGFGWHPSMPDSRDRFFHLEEVVLKPTQVAPVGGLLPSELPPIWDQGQVGSCFPAGTFIRMADGSERPIEDVRLGEFVVTAEGNTGRVRQTMLRTEVAGLHAVSLWGRKGLRMTAEHPVLTERGYVAACDLRIGDWVAQPRYAPAFRRTKVEVGEYVARRERLIKNGVRKFGALPGRADVAVRVASLPDEIQLNARFGRLVGLFLAEGSTSSGKSIWTFGSHEEGTLVAEAVDLLRDLGVEAHVQHRPNNSINVVAYGTAWSRFWTRLCGTGAGEKVPHAALMQGPDEFLAAMLDGWLAGDGWHTKRAGRVSRMTGVSISERLAMAMYDIAQHLGRRPAFRFAHGKKNAAALSRQRYFEVELSSQSDSYRCKLAATHCWRKVRAIEQQEFAGDVYNLSVEGDESYVAGGIGVHNCTAHGSLRAYLAEGMRQGLKIPMLSRLETYYNTRAEEGTAGSDSGASVRDAIRALAIYGCAPESEWPYDVSKFAVQPPQSVYDDSKKHMAFKYQQIIVGGPGAPMRTALTNKLAIVFGFPVPAYFEDGTWDPASEEPLRLPGPSDQYIGGHSVTLTAWNFSGKFISTPSTNRRVRPYFTADNSWSESFGMAGRFNIDSSWFTPGLQLASDLWVFQAVT